MISLVIVVVVFFPALLVTTAGLVRCLLLGVCVCPICLLLVVFLPDTRVVMVSLVLLVIVQENISTFATVVLILMLCLCWCVGVLASHYYA